MLRFSKKIKHVSIFLLIIILLLSFPLTAFATETVGSISLSYAVQGADFSLYKVGTVTPYGEFVIADELSDYEVDIESENVAVTLASYIQSDNIKPLATAVTDENSIAKFNNVDEGIYLITGSSKIVDNVKYTALPVLVSLPFVYDESLVWDLEVNGKYEKVPYDSYVEISVLKIWKNVPSENLQPKEVSVSLTKNGEVYDTIKLNSDNNWKHKWSKLSEKDQWAVIENNVPNGYEVNIQKDKNTFVVTNTYKETPTPPTPNTPDLPQTGQLWWPVYVLGVAGICFIFVGIIQRRKNV